MDCQAPLSMQFSRQEYWRELSFFSTGDLPNPRIKPRSPALQANSLPSEPPQLWSSVLNETFWPLGESHTEFRVANILKLYLVLLVWCMSQEKSRNSPRFTEPPRSKMVIKIQFPEYKPTVIWMFFLEHTPCSCPRVRFSGCEFPNVLAESIFQWLVLAQLTLFFLPSFPSLAPPALFLPSLFSFFSPLLFDHLNAWLNSVGRNRIFQFWGVSHCLDLKCYFYYCFSYRELKPLRISLTHFAITRNWEFPEEGLGAFSVHLGALLSSFMISLSSLFNLSAQVISKVTQSSPSCQMCLHGFHYLLSALTITPTPYISLFELSFQFFPCSPLPISVYSTILHFLSCEVIQDLTWMVKYHGLLSQIFRFKFCNQFCYLL